MTAPAARTRGVDDDPSGAQTRNRWRTRISGEQERRFYFLAILALVACYLVTRVL